MPIIQVAASSLGIDISAAPVRAREDIEGVISGRASKPGAGLIVMPDVFNVGNSNLIIHLRPDIVSRRLILMSPNLRDLAA